MYEKGYFSRSFSYYSFLSCHQYTLLILNCLLSPTEHFVLYNYNPEGNRLDVLIYQSLIESQAEVYKDGLLIQQAVANKQTMTVQSVIYDLPNESNSFNNQNTSFSKEMGFTGITQHKAQSTNSLNLVIPFSTRSS